MLRDDLDVILNRPSTDIEWVAYRDGAGPAHKVGDLLEGQDNWVGEVEAVVLFEVNSKQYSWGVRLKGQDNFRPQNTFTKVIDKVN